MNQNETIIGHDEGITVDTELLPRREKEREDHIIMICICYAVN